MTNLAKIIADFTTQMALKNAVGATTGTLQGYTDDDGVALPTGTYYFTIDGDNSQKEYIQAVLGASGALTAIKSVSRAGVITSGFARVHRVGASVSITDFAHIKMMLDLLAGTTSFDAATPLGYDAVATLTTGSNQFATVKYVDGIAIAGSPDATTTTKGIGRVSVAPASPTIPIFVGDNDPRVPTQAENDALVGTSGTAVSGSNKLVDNADTSTTSVASKVPRALGTGLLDPAWIPPVSATFTAGEALTAGDALHLTPFYQSDGGILRDTSAQASFTNLTNQVLALTVAANSNRALIVAVVAGAAPSSVTYNSVAMTLIDSQIMASPAVTLYLYKLIAPSTGANNISVTSTGIYKIMGLSLYNVHQSTFVEASAKAATTSVAITTLSAMARVVSVTCHYHSSGSASISGGSYSNKYNSGSPGSNFSSRTDTADQAAFIASMGLTSVFNATAATTPTSTQSGGSGTVEAATIAVSLAAATAASVGVVKASSAAISTNEPLIDFVGFANSSVSAGASVSVTIAGVVTGLSGLTAGQKYYLQDTAGTIGTSKGAYGKIVGKAVTATTLLIQPDKAMSAQIAKTANYTYTAECDGFVTANVPASTTVTITTDGVGSAGTSPAATSTLLTVPVSRGKTYIVSSAGTNPYFTPLA